MPQFDIYQNPGGSGLLLDVQATLLDELATRVMVPLLPLTEFSQAAKRLNPVFDIGGIRFVMVTQFLAAVPVNELRDRTGTLAACRDEIVGAIDVLLSGV